MLMQLGGSCSCSPRRNTGCLQPGSPALCRRALRHAVTAAAKKSPKGSALAGLMKKKQEAEETKAAGGERATPAQYRDPEVRGLLFSLASSYYKATKQYLVEVDLEQLADAVWHGDFVCLVHDKFQQGVTDPCFIYANKAALELWEASWEELIGMPSRLSAVDDPVVQQDRLALLEQAAGSKSGVVNNYEGWRVSLKGKKFKVKGVTLFNIVDFSRTKIGQAAIFKEYELEDGTVMQVKSDPWQPPVVELPPSEEELKAAEGVVQQWADYVRALKAQGRGNQDEEVLSAVAELKVGKQIVEDIRKRIEDALAAAEAAFDDE